MGLSADGSGPGAETIGNYSVPNAGSISFWMRPHTLNIGMQRFLANDTDFEGLFYGINDTVSNFRCGGTANCYLNTTVEETLYHVVCTYDTADEAAIYVDGVLEDTHGTVETGTINDTIQMFDRAGTSDPADTDLHDVRLYNRVLTPAEIQTIFAARGGDDIVHGMTSRWPMFEGPPGSTISGTGVIKDIGSAKNNFSSASGAPDWVYDAALIPRRR